MNRARFLIIQRAAHIAAPTAVVRLGRATLIAGHDLGHAPEEPFDLLLTDRAPVGDSKTNRGVSVRLVDTGTHLYLCASPQSGFRFGVPPASPRVDGAPVPVEPGVSFLVQGMRYTVADDCGAEVVQYAAPALALGVQRNGGAGDYALALASKREVIGGWTVAPADAPLVNMQQVPAHTGTPVASTSPPVFHLAMAGGNPGSSFGFSVALTERPTTVEVAPALLAAGVALTSSEPLSPLEIDWSTAPTLRLSARRVGVHEPLHFDRFSIMLRTAPVPWVPNARVVI